MASPIMKYFTYEHLPPKLQEVSKPIGELAKQMDESLPDGAEKSAGLRKLLEAKDCLVRAILPLMLFVLTLPTIGHAEERFGGYTFDELGCYQPGPNVTPADQRDDAGAMRNWLATQRSDYLRRLDVIDQKYAPGRSLNPPGNDAGTDEPLVRVLRHDAERNAAWEDYRARVGEKEAAKTVVAIDDNYRRNFELDDPEHDAWYEAKQREKAAAERKSVPTSVTAVESPKPAPKKSPTRRKITIEFSIHLD